MSASSKKKLRKEQNAAALTEKQQKELKEAKKLKTYTMTFIVVMVLVVAIVVGILVRTPINAMLIRGTDAVTIGNHTLDTADLSYYYVDSIQDLYYTYYSQFGSYASIYMQMMGLDLSKAMNEQTTKDEDGNEITWADYFINQAIENATSMYAVYDAAVAAGHELTEEEQASLDKTWANVESAAKNYGYSSAGKYLQLVYGAGSTKASYLEYCKVKAIAQSFYSAYADSLEYTDENYREYEKDKFDEYSSFTYKSYYISVSAYKTFLKLGTKDEDGKTTYTDEEEELALEAAKKDMETLLANDNGTAFLFEKGIALLDINKDKDSDDISITDVEDTFYNKISNEEIREWLADEEREFADVTAIPNTTTTGEGDDEKTVTNGYYILFFQERNDNTELLANVRHILVAFEGGSYDSSTGETTYTDAEKTKAKEEAEALLKQWQEGEKTEESFAALADEKTDDTGSKGNGGLYEDIYPGQMVEAFNDWCFDEDRKEGDVEIIETSYGYHIMYYVGESEMTYRDYMIDNDLTNEDTSEWHDGLVEKMQVTRLDLSRMEYDYKMG
ncbi:MAG: peptidylprolyl isomerase [Faecousia sp.]